ncbi:hypothetical protein GLOIN_2v1790954 [Rhizophagus clarus]|uniref:Uncharacterized protein n=1 Tax=Rhizophagus clarus TaxID=94130 RepID=A0A8H3LEV0_9GLOM|nr:hypothetical protein GLOIN_2v1790954 [Rhizophagus clarus]
MHTLKDIEDKGVVGGLLGKQIPSGRRLGSNRESELEKALRGSIKTASDIANDYKELQDVCLKQKKDLMLVQANANKKISQLNATNTRFRSSEQLSHTERKAEREKYSAEIKSLKFLIKILEKEATLAQKASSLDKIKILSLEAKISELEDVVEESEVVGGTRSCLSASGQSEPSSVSGLEKDNDITNPELACPQRDPLILPITADYKYY